MFSCESVTKEMCDEENVSQVCPDVGVASVIRKHHKNRY